MILLGFASITLDVERSRSRVWCSLDLDMGVRVVKMEESIEAGCQASLKMAQNQLEDCSQRITAVSRMTKPLARLAQGRNSATESFREPIPQHSPPMSQPSPESKLCMAVWKLMKIQQAWDRIQSQFQDSTQQKKLLEVHTGTTDWVANLFWIEWSSVA